MRFDLQAHVGHAVEIARIYWGKDGHAIYCQPCDIFIWETFTPINEETSA